MSKKANHFVEVTATIRSSELFDGEWYCEQYAEIRALALDPVEHYSKVGFLINRDPSPLFSTAGYLKDHPDVAQANVNPLYHYIKWGRSEGRQIRPSSISQASPAVAPIKNAPAGAKSLSNKGKGFTQGRQSEEAGFFQTITPRHSESTHSVDLDVAVARAPRYTESDHANYFSVDELEKRLWGGYSTLAVPLLERVKRDGNATLSDRVDAAWYLARWFYFVQDFGRAHENASFLKFCRPSAGHWARSYVARGTIQQVTALSTMARPAAMLATYVLQVQCLVRLQRFPEAISTLNAGLLQLGTLPDFHLLRANLSRLSNLSNTTADSNVDAMQLQALNQTFLDVGLAPLQLKDPSKPLHFFNLEAVATAEVTDQSEKVTIIIPAYNSSGTLGVSLTSLINQTWRNLEIIVVDDFSTDDTREIVQSYEREDPRVRLIAKPKNEGAYPARNLGLKAATGDLIMVHDSDDWSHPQKIERQIVHLRSKKNCVAVMSHWVRFDEWLVALGRWRPVGSLFDLNFSSLLFRRVVLDRLKGWDNVRVSGDAEFRYRIQEVFGINAIRNVPRRFLLSLSLSREDSLTQSKSTHLRSLEFGLRWQYRDAYQYWYNTAKQTNTLAMDGTNRKFPIPLGNKSNRDRATGYDLVVVADFAEAGEGLAQAMSYLYAAKAAALNVAAVHWRRFELDPHSPLLPEFYACCLATNAEILTPGDLVRTKLLLFTQPSILQYRQDSFPSIFAEGVAVLVSSLGASSRQQHRYDRLVAKTNLYEITGREVEWIPTSPTMRSVMQEEDHSLAKSGLVWAPLIDIPDWNVDTRRTHQAKAPVIGRAGADDSSAWPNTKQEFELVYGQGMWEVVFLGSANHALRVIGRLPKNFKVLSEIDALASAFHSSIDFFVYYPSEAKSAGGDHYIAEALANGIPVILPPLYRTSYGDAATYAEPQQVEQAIASLWDSELSYSRQARLGRKYAEQHFSYVHLRKRITQLCSDGTEA